MLIVLEECKVEDQKIFLLINACIWHLPTQLNLGPLGLHDSSHLYPGLQGAELSDVMQAGITCRIASLNLR